MSIEAHIRSEYEASHTDDAEPKLPIEIFAAGFKAGMRIGQQIADEVIRSAKEKAESEGFDRGKAQGLAYAAYAASHVSTIDIHSAMKPSEAATQMRDNITATLELARNLAMTRANGKT